MKRCPKCGRLLPETEFYKNCRSGLSSWCKGCYSERRPKNHQRSVILRKTAYVPTREDLEELYVKQKRSLNGIAKILDTNYSLVRKKAIEYGFSIRSNSESQRVCISLGYIDKNDRRKPVYTDAERQKRRERMKELRASLTPVGYALKPSGYYEVTVGENKFRPLHDVIMEEHIGRRLHKNECVHHINHDKTDNRVENLMLLTKSEHSKLHCRERLAAGEDLAKHLHRK